MPFEFKSLFIPSLHIGFTRPFFTCRVCEIRCESTRSCLVLRNCRLRTFYNNVLKPQKPNVGVFCSRTIIKCGFSFHPIGKSRRGAMVTISSLADSFVPLNRICNSCNCTHVDGRYSYLHGNVEEHRQKKFVVYCH